MHQIVVLQLPFHGTDRDIEVLQGLPNVSVRKIQPEQFPQGTRGAKLLILPGSAQTISDLSVLRSEGGEDLVRSHLAQGGFVFGLCGGMQWMCERLLDPHLSEGDQPSVTGMSLIPDSTTVWGTTMLSTHTTAVVTLAPGCAIEGVEHRRGFTTFSNDKHAPLATIVDRKFDEPKPDPQMLPTIDRNGQTVSSYWAPGTEPVDGIVMAGGQIWASYIHLILTNESFLALFLPNVLT